MKTSKTSIMLPPTSPLTVILGFVLSFLIATPAFADGGYHESGGCEGAGIFFLVVFGLIALAVLALAAIHQVKMWTDPDYKEDYLERQREERKRLEDMRGGY